MIGFEKNQQLIRTSDRPFYGPDERDTFGHGSETGIVRARDPHYPCLTP
jgi:hypothetical protein